MHDRSVAWRRWIAGVGLALGLADSASGIDRHEEHTRQFAQGPKATFAAGTYIGGPGHEELIGVATLPDGRILACGNVWGDPFTDRAPVKVLGLDALWDVPLHEPGTEYDKEGRRRPPSSDNPNRTGFMAFFKPDLSAVISITRFGYGLASITAARQMTNKTYVITGLCTAKFRGEAKKAGLLKIEPRDPQDAKMGPYSYADVEFPGDVYIACLSQDLTSLLWVWIFEGHRTAPDRVFEGAAGTVVADVRGVRSIVADGRDMVNLDKIRRMKGGSYVHKFLAVSPYDGTILFGGDHQSGTGREPWRKPIVVAYDGQGNLKYRYYDFDGPVVGHDRYRLVSDSSARVAAFAPNGELAISFWSDGGNTIVTRSPVDLDKPALDSGLGMSPWGSKGAKSYAHLVRFHPDRCDPVHYTFWGAYMAAEPNSITINGMLALRDGATAIYGGSASWLVQTPNALYAAADRPSAGRGEYVTVFGPGFKQVWFSSALAQCRPVAMAETDAGLVVASTARDGEAEGGNRPPVRAGWQMEFGGGLGDGHLLLIHRP